jgi:hypothetical protein
MNHVGTPQPRLQSRSHTTLEIKQMISGKESFLDIKVEIAFSSPRLKHLTPTLQSSVNGGTESNVYNYLIYFYAAVKVKFYLTATSTIRFQKVPCPR